jgi:hypothetical protein
VRRGSQIEKPIFIIGMGRSGTTLLYNAVASHRDLGWVSKQVEKTGMPAFACLSRLGELHPAARRGGNRSDDLPGWVEELRVGPVEAWRTWERCCGEKFLYDYLLDVEASESERACVQKMVSRVLRYQGKRRFVAKPTGPARIYYLSSIFPDAKFIHAVRDGRATVSSLVRFAAWRDSPRMHAPAWQNPPQGFGPQTPTHYPDDDPIGLAAIQWQEVVLSTRAEAEQHAPDRYTEVPYERFVADPHTVLDELIQFAELPPSPHAHAFIDRRMQVRDLSDRWRERLGEAEIERLTALMQRGLEAYGYPLDSTENERKLQASGSLVRAQELGERG